MVMINDTSTSNLEQVSGNLASEKTETWLDKKKKKNTKREPWQNNKWENVAKTKLKPSSSIDLVVNKLTESSCNDD